MYYIALLLSPILQLRIYDISIFNDLNKLSENIYQFVLEVFKTKINEPDTSASDRTDLKRAKNSSDRS